MTEVYPDDNELLNVQSNNSEKKESMKCDYDMDQLGWWVHLLTTRSSYRADPKSRKKDLQEARSYLNMMDDVLSHLEDQLYDDLKEIEEPNISTTPEASESDKVSEPVPSSVEKVGVEGSPEPLLGKDLVGDVLIEALGFEEIPKEKDPEVAPSTEDKSEGSTLTSVEEVPTVDPPEGPEPNEPDLPRKVVGLDSPIGLESDTNAQKDTTEGE